MTKDEIKALISAKVAGQGDQVDAGGALAQILDEIIDAIPEPVTVPDWLDGVPVIEREGQITKAEYDRLIGQSAVVFHGRLLTLCTDINTVSRYVASHEGGLFGALYVDRFCVDNAEALDTMHGITIYFVSSNECYVVEEDD